MAPTGSASRAPTTESVARRLWVAAARGDLAFVTDLLSNRADIDAKHRGWAALLKASELNRTSLVQLIACREDVA